MSMDVVRIAWSRGSSGTPRPAHSLRLHVASETSWNRTPATPDFRIHDPSCEL
jgi:hypothetical protein